MKKLFTITENLNLNLRLAPVTKQYYFSYVR
jgi:hypothetical protein